MSRLLSAEASSPEHVALVRGLKPAIRLAPGEALGEVVLSARKRGLAIGVEEDGAGRALVYLAPSATRVDALVAAERRSRGGGASAVEAHLTLGRLLGYPACCVEAFLARLARDPPGPGISEDFLVLSALLEEPGPFHGRINPFPRTGPHTLISHYPCGPACEPSLAYAEAVFEALPPEERAGLRSRLMEPVAISPAGSRTRPEEAADGARILAPTAF